jgi:hypothetical protein
MNRFEQLIEYVINDEEQKAKELFHDIVVAKSREIYESMMAEEAEELDEAEEEEEEELDEDAMGGDASDDLIDEIETEETSDISMESEDNAEFDDEAEEDGDDLTHDLEADHDEGEAATKDDIMNLEDKLDQLMAEFEAAMGGDAMGSDGDGFGPEEGGDAIEMDDTEEMMSENITLKQVHPKTTTSEEGDGKAGPVAFNSGAAGMAAKPVKTTGETAQGRPAPTTKELIGKVGNSPAQGTQDLKAATKPVTSQASGVNTKSPLPSRKG